MSEHTRRVSYDGIWQPAEILGARSIFAASKRKVKNLNFEFSVSRQEMAEGLDLERSKLGHFQFRNAP